MSDDEDRDICYKQPENEEELEQCYEAMETALLKPLVMTASSFSSRS